MRFKEYGELMPNDVLFVYQAPRKSRRIIPKLSQDELAKRSETRKQTKSLIARGVIFEPVACQNPKCGADAHRLEPHHIHYDEPAWVIWLCIYCHKRVHREHKAMLLLEGKKT